MNSELKVTTLCECITKKGKQKYSSINMTHSDNVCHHSSEFQRRSRQDFETISIHRLQKEQRGECTVVNLLLYLNDIYYPGKGLEGIKNEDRARNPMGVNKKRNDNKEEYSVDEHHVCKQCPEQHKRLFTHEKT